MTHYYYHQDHLGNICAVWDATHDSVGATSGDKEVGEKIDCDFFVL